MLGNWEQNPGLPRSTFTEALENVCFLMCSFCALSSYMETGFYTLDASVCGGNMELCSLVNEVSIEARQEITCLEGTFQI